MNGKKYFIPVLLIVLLSASGNLFSGEKEDLDSYYYSPVSIGVFYRPLSGIASRSLSDFSINEISGQIRFSFENTPEIQPFITGGVESCSFIGDIDTYHQDWSHTHLFGGLGLGYSSRISKEFELGLEGFAAVSQSFFTQLSLPGLSDSLGQLNILAGAEMKLILNPSFNMSIGITPSVRYLYGLGELDIYNGFTFGVGFGASYRFGDDPDSPKSVIRALKFVKADIPSAFAAMQSYYSTHPLGSVTIKNTEKYPLSNLEVSFMQQGFMDSPTPSKNVETLAPGESLELPVFASYNGEVFTTQGVTPLTGEIIVQYTAKGRPAEQRHSVTYDLYDRNALTWDDDRKVAAFITPQDSALRNYASFIRQANKTAVNRYMNENLQFAMQSFEALSEFGILYQIDPTSPFTTVQEKKFVVDSISLPRETLVRSTGDCDDLTVLYNTVLQTVGIETAFVTVPGHIFSAFNTGVRTRDYRKIYPDRSMVLDVDGELWIFVEITLIGKTDFLKAWKTGVAEYTEHENNPSVRGFYKTLECQKTYRPVALRETDLGLQYGDPGRITKRFVDDLDQLTAIVLQPYKENAEKKNSAGAWNSYGIMAAKLGNNEAAAYAFNKVVRLSPNSLAAKLNLGSLFFLQGKYGKAAKLFEESYTQLSERAHARRKTKVNVLINLSKTNFKMQKFTEARKYFNEAKEIDPETVQQFSFLAAGKDSSGTSRAAGASEGEPILFFED